MNMDITNTITWEEFASALPKNVPDTDKLLAAACYRFEVESIEEMEIKTVLNDYFRRARWNRPVNLSATANYCAGKGWLSEVGRTGSQKFWKITKRGYDVIKEKVQG